MLEACRPDRIRFAQALTALGIGLIGSDAFAQAQTVAEAANSPPSRAIDRLRAWRAIEAERRAEIEAEVAAGGPFSYSLYEMYFSLAQHYRERNEHLLAAEALEDALHVQRVTHGLFSMEQVAVAQELIDSSIAAGRIERVAELDAQLLRIARQNLDDVRSARILHETADRQLQVYQRYLAGDLPAQVTLSIDSGQPGENVDSNELIGMSNLAEARRNYRAAIRVLLRTGEGTDDDVLALETRLIEGYFIEAESARERDSRSVSILLGNVGRRHGRLDSLFKRGEAAYLRIRALAIKSNDVEIAARALIGLADWNLLFSKNSTALELYRNAYSALRELGATQRFLNEIFAPEIPVVLPAFNANPLLSGEPEAAQKSDDFVDVTMVMSRYGRSRSRDLRTSAEPAKESIARSLRRIVTTSRFRPRIVDGEAQNRTEIEFRYYINSEDS